MLKRTLAAMGLSPTETAVYLYLVKRGCSYPGKISSATKRNRTTPVTAISTFLPTEVL